MRNDGHAHHIGEAYREGIRMFVEWSRIWRRTNILWPVCQSRFKHQSPSELASHHRSQFDCPVISITGSNGKTIVKNGCTKCCRQNSIVLKPRRLQLTGGRPLSVWPMGARHEWACSGLGFPYPGKWRRCGKSYNPPWAYSRCWEFLRHDEGSPPREKLLEKLQLFQSCKTIILPG